MELISELQDVMLDNKYIKHKLCQPQIQMYENDQNQKAHLPSSIHLLNQIQIEDTSSTPAFPVQKKIIEPSQMPPPPLPPLILPNKQKNIFIPREKDTLFWCFYILKNGETKYETMYSKNEVIAKQIKIEYVDIIRKNKQIIKTHKFDAISNIENNLANENYLNIKTFFTLCAIENINILFVINKTYYELLTNDKDELFIFYSLPTGGDRKNYRYGYEINKNNKANDIKETHFKIENIGKPILSMSSYKITELLEICNKLNIETINKETGKTKLKKDLYESIVQNF